MTGDGTAGKLCWYILEDWSILCFDGLNGQYLLFSS